MTVGAVRLVRSRPLLLFTSFPIKLSHQPSQSTGLPLHFLVVGFVATPFSAANSTPRSPYPPNRNLSSPVMDEEAQQYERHALPACNRDRLCVNFRLLSPLNLPASREAPLCVERRTSAVQASIHYSQGHGISTHALVTLCWVLGPRTWALGPHFVYPSERIPRIPSLPPSRPTQSSPFSC